MKVKRGLVALLSGALLMMPWAVAAASAPPTVSSLSAVVYEPQSGRVLYEKDGRTARPMASTTKLMTALLATELLDMESIVQVPSGAVPVEGTQLGLAVGESISVRDLLAGLLLSSGNDAANALALLMDDSLPAFAQRMNARAAALGMTDSLFVTPSGLDQGGHSASARDMALLGAAVLQKPSAAELCAAKTATVTIGGRRMTISNHNKLLRLYEGCIGLKTGFTKKSGRCLVSAATQNGVTLVIATLNGGDYWNDHMALYKYAFSLVRQEPLSPPILPPVAVAGGLSGQIQPIADAALSQVLLREERVSCRVELPAFLWAPLDAGQEIGRVTYMAGERVLAVVPIRCAKAVPARPSPSWVSLWCRRFRQLLDALL